MDECKALTTAANNAKSAYHAAYRVHKKIFRDDVTAMDVRGEEMAAFTALTAAIASAAKFQGEG